MAKVRKEKEKERMRSLILKTADEIVIDKGLDALTMRLIGQKIEYSQSKIYEFFSTKDQLCEALCQIHCENLIENLQSIPKKRDTGYYLTDLIRQTLEYHRSHPHSDALMTLVCFEPERFKIPDNFLKIEILFKEALKELNSPFLKSAKDLEIALTIIRYLFIGTSHLMNTKNNSSESLEIAMNAIHILIKGWKSV